MAWEWQKAENEQEMDDLREQLLNDVREFDQEDTNIIWGHQKSL
jgi:hypothetical protein